MPKCARLQMVEQLHLGNGWRSHQAALFLVPMVHSPPMSHAAVNLRCLHVLVWGHGTHLHQSLSQPLSLSDPSAFAWAPLEDFMCICGF